MYFVQWLNSLDELLYELMSWLVFFPLTLWRIVTRPLKTLRYAEEQLKLEPALQYRGTVSPPIMLILAILLSQAIAMAIEGTNPIVASKRGMAALVGDNTTLLLLRIFLFGIFAVVAAAWKVQRSDEPIDRETLKLPFYAQCYAVSPFALLMALAGVCIDHHTNWVRVLGFVFLVTALLTFGVVQLQWLKAELRQSAVRSFLDATIIMVISLTVFLGIGLLFVS